jgi:hypothetical protein
MSGGSLDYIYGKVEDAADSIRGRAFKPLHLAFAEHLRLVATALHDLEWVFSSDTSPGDEDAAILKVLNKQALAESTAADLAERISQANEVISLLNKEWK